MNDLTTGGGETMERAGGGAPAGMDAPIIPMGAGAEDLGTADPAEADEARGGLA